MEVLSLLGHFPSWVEYRGHRQREFLALSGIRHGWTHARDAETVGREIAARGARVVLNEVWCLPPLELAKVAARFPAVQFVALSHAVPGWEATRYGPLHYTCQRLAREVANVHFGTVMPVDRVAAVPGTRVVSLPNFCQLPQGLPDREPGPPTVSLIARDDEGKQWGAAVAAVILAARMIPDLHVVIGCPDVFKGIAPQLAHLSTCGVPWVRLLWDRWEAYLDRVARSVDCHLTATLAESCCLVPLEHCLLGRPVVGTAAVEWLPSRWQCNPQDPAAMAAGLARHFEDYATASTKARAVAESVVARHHRQLITNLQNLIA